MAFLRVFWCFLVVFDGFCGKWVPVYKLFGVFWGLGFLLK